MANGFDRKGAVVGVILLIVFVAVAAAVLLPFKNPVTIKIDIPPAQPSSR